MHAFEAFCKDWPFLLPSPLVSVLWRFVRKQSSRNARTFPKTEIQFCFSVYLFTIHPSVFKCKDKVRSNTSHCNGAKQDFGKKYLLEKVCLFSKYRVKIMKYTFVRFKSTILAIIHTCTDIPLTLDGLLRVCRYSQ